MIPSWWKWRRMGRRKRPRGRHGAGGRASTDKPSRDLELEEEGQMGMVSGANGDQHMDQMGIVGGDSSAYLVACHSDWALSSEPYCVYKMVDSETSSPRKRLKRLGRVKTTVAGGKVFISVRSRSWIVGVGGDKADTVIFDTKTDKVIQGPNPKSAKWCPVLTTVGDKVYAMSKNPSWTSDPDFPPWFEVLDLSKASVVTDADSSHLEGCSWRDLPHPPCIPWELTPFRYTMLPIVILVSYVVIGLYILVSFNEPDWGTWAFDTSSDKWHKVDDKRLPFAGRATQHAGSIFLGVSSHKKKGPITAYRIHVDKDHAPLKLSITVLPVKYREDEVVDAGSCFSSLDNAHFCSLSLSVDSHSYTFVPRYGGLISRKVHVNLKTYQIEDPSVLETSEETVKSIAISNQREQVLKISSSEHGFTPFAFTLLSI